MKIIIHKSKSNDKLQYSKSDLFILLLFKPIFILSEKKDEKQFLFDLQLNSEDTNNMNKQFPPNVCDDDCNTVRIK